GGAKAATFYTDYSEMLEKERPDVVHICTPHYLHVPMTIEAAKRGCAVFMEKPPAISEESFQDLLNGTRGATVGVCFQNRYNPNVQYVRELLMNRVPLGARAFVTWSRDGAYYTENDWRGKLATEGGGALMNQTIHTLDLLVYLLGCPIMVDATIANHHLKDVIEVEDTVEARLKFEQGCVALFYASTAYCTNSPVMIEILCEDRMIRLENSDATTFFHDGRVEHKHFEESDALGKDYWGNGHARCIEDFYRRLAKGQPAPIPLDFVTATMSAVFRIYLSASEKQT
ncbi:MAG: Gfo/Idh/MocA family oxidoreductase, partial [Clostridiales bacterium]|nr:Gfo/Idh/MocA family oxidoreductase [Clostridiales bacterium]